ncbi:MAG TPA: DUF2939 domain-containing protein [Caulobacteraceae bacterium]|nr:DUF2939 domain-containing protein [Caulobacteraceae bacterium]
MDDDLTLSPDDRPPPAGGRRRWEAVETRLDQAAHDRRFDPYAGPPRPARRPRPLLAILLILVAAACAGFAVAPLLAFRALRSAAEYGDVKALSEVVDYDAVRQSLRTQLRPSSAERKPPADLLHDPLGALRRAWEPAGPQADVDLLLTPEALAGLSEGRGPGGPRAAPAKGLFGGPVPAVRYWGFDRVRLGVTDPQRPTRETVFAFQRRKLFDWRLVAVRLPQETP